MPENSPNSNSTNVDEIARLVLEQIDKGEVATTVTPRSTPVAPAAPASKLTINRPPTAANATQSQCLYTDLDEATHAARMAQRKFLDCPLEIRKQIVANIRVRALEQAERLGQLAVTETGLGKMPDKMNKIILVANKTPGPEDLQPVAY